MELTQEIVTPAVAQEMLKANTGNRRLRVRYVTQLVNALQRGEWKMSPQGISFDRNGRLLDGQHRLMAIVQSGIPAPLAVLRNCDPETFEVLDQGVRRDVDDTYRIGKSAASVCSHLARFLYGRNISRSQVKELYDVIELDLKDVVDATHHSRVFCTAAIMAAALVNIRSGQSRRYVLGVLRDLSLWKFSELPSVANSFVRFKQDRNHGSLRLKIAAETEEYIRALVIFDERAKNNTKVTVRDIDARVAAVKELTEGAILDPKYRI